MLTQIMESKKLKRYLKEGYFFITKSNYGGTVQQNNDILSDSKECLETQNQTCHNDLYIGTIHIAWGLSSRVGLTYLARGSSS